MHRRPPPLLMAMPIDVLHLAYTRFPADTRLQREIRALTASGRRVAVVVLRGDRDAAVERWHGAVVIRVPGRKTRGGVAAYLREYGEFAWRCRRLLTRHRALRRVRVVHVHTLPDFLLWAALPARRRGARLILDMHEVFPEFVAARFRTAAGWLASAIAGAIERWARRTADLTITVNEPIAELLEGRPARPDERRLVVHNTADPADFGAPRSSATAADLGRLELVYHGTLTALYGLDIAIRGVVQARAGGIAVRLTIIGEGPERHTLRRLAAATADPDTIRFEDPIPQAALRARIEACHAGVVPTSLDGMTRYSLSTKLLEYVHLGIPVLATLLPSYARYFGNDALWYWTAGASDDLARVIRDFKNASPQVRERRATLARRAIERFAWPLEAARLLQAYDDVLDQAPAQAARDAAMRSAARPSP